MNPISHDYIKNTIATLVKTNKISQASYGIAGSYARNEATKYSDLDIVVDRELSLEEIDAIKNAFDIEVDVLFIDLLKKEDDELDAMLTQLGLPTNDESVYKTIKREVNWIEM